jgi:tRNA A37 N6-isopentenylltransferase MiaA
MTEEEIEHRLKQMEVDLIRLEAVTENTGKKLDRLAEIVYGTGETASGLAETHRKTDETLAMLAKAMASLNETVDRYLCRQRNGELPR